MNDPVSHTFETRLTYKLNYLLYLPEGYANGGPVPLLLYLHGGGESGDDLERLKICGLPKRLEDGEKFPFIVLAPQNPHVDQLFPEEAIFALLEKIITSYPVDRKRVYLTGYSRGGFAAWGMATQRPDLFAALVPVAAGGLATYAFRTQEVPVWTFHGALDEAVPPLRCAEMVEALRAAGGSVKLTVFPGADHADTLEQTYCQAELYRWLLEQKKVRLTAKQKNLDVI